MKALPLSAKFPLLLLLLLNVPDSIKCQDVKPENKNVYSEVVLEIPPIKITRYEYEKNLNEFTNNYTNAYKTAPPEEVLRNWQKDFIDKMYLLAELNNQGFGNRQDVLNTVNSMERIIITQDYGLVYDEFVKKKINITEDAVKAAYEKSGKHILVEFLRFPDYDSLYSTVIKFKSNARIETKKDFNTLADVCKGFSQNRHDSIEFVWPYLRMDDFADSIYKLKKDDIIPFLITKNGVFVYWAKAVYEKEKLPYDNAKAEIRKILEENQRTILQSAYQSKIDSAVTYHVNEALCSKFMKIYSIDLFKDLNESSRTERLHLQFKDILNDTLLTYSYGSIKSLLSVKDFLKHYSNGAIMLVFKDSRALSNYLSGYAQEEYLLELADSLGIKNNIIHQLNKKNYKNKTILSFYEARDLLPNIMVSDNEIEKYYKDNQKEFQSGAAAEVSLYIFDTEENARFGRMYLTNTMNISTQTLMEKLKAAGLKQADSNFTVTRSDNKFGPDIIRLIFNLGDAQYSQPVKFSEGYAIIKKLKETGSMVKPLEEVKEEIVEIMKRIKCDNIKNEKILQAKRKYQIKVNELLSNR